MGPGAVGAKGGLDVGEERLGVERGRVADGVGAGRQRGSHIDAGAGFQLPHGRCHIVRHLERLEAHSLRTLEVASEIVQKEDLLRGHLDRQPRKGQLGEGGED